MSQNYEIKITCKGADLLPLDSLKNFQGGLKKISKQNLEKLKKRIIRDGINVPLFVWNENECFKILDGHQRLKALQSLKGDGYNISMIPVCYIEAEDEKDARQKLLGITSQFGEFEIEELGEWMNELDEDLKDTLRLSNDEIKIDNFYTDNDEIEVEKELPRNPFGDERDLMDLKNLFEQYEKVLINFSGGKDSICTLLEVLKYCPKEKIELVFVRIEFDYPDLTEYVNYILDNYFDGIKCNYLFNEKAIENLPKYGFPSGLNRWCNSGMKIKPVNDLHKKLKSENVKFITCIGTRAAESSTREKMLNRGTWGLTDYVFPIQDWSDEKVVTEIDNNNIPAHSYYKFFNRLSCFVCPNKSKKDYATLKKYLPDLYFKALEYITIGLQSDAYRQGEFCFRLFNSVVNCGTDLIKTEFNFKKYYDTVLKKEIE